MSSNPPDPRPRNAGILPALPVPRSFRARSHKWWLLPFGILAAAALVASGIVVFRPATTECSGAPSAHYACHQERYRNLVRDSGVEAAFVQLKDEYKEDEFVRSSCHQLTHVIGRAAAERYGGISGAYPLGQHLCGTGYYHGVMETVVARIGAEEVLADPDALCVGVRESQKYSAVHSGCAHGLGHGFMGILDNELFESLEACDALTDGWEREHCYNGVFMENLPDSDNRSHPSKYLREHRPLYPCTVVEERYKTQCYQKQTTYVLQMRGYDFSKVFDLCAAVEKNSRPACYQGLGRNAFEQSVRQNITDVAQTESADMLCALGEEHEARSNCLIGAVRYFILCYHDDERARALCESLEADLRVPCSKAVEKYRGDLALD